MYVLINKILIILHWNSKELKLECREVPLGVYKSYIFIVDVIRALVL